MSLHRDAASTLDCLTQAHGNRITSRLLQSDFANDRDVERESTSLDARLFSYIRKCQMAGNVALLDELHNISLNRRLETQHVVKRSRVHREIVAHSEQYSELRTLAAALVVCIWQAALSSPYMASHKRTQEAFFQPFAAGVYVSTKRGVNLETKEGTEVLIPKCPLLAEALPAVRGEHKKNMRPHKGVTCMQLVLKSVPKSKAHIFFADAIRAARALQQRADVMMAASMESA